MHSLSEECVTAAWRTCSKDEFGLARCFRICLLILMVSVGTQASGSARAAEEAPPPSALGTQVVLATPLMSPVPECAVYEDLIAELATRMGRTIRLDTESFARLGFRISDHSPVDFAGMTLDQSLKALVGGHPHGLTVTASMTED